MKTAVKKIDRALKSLYNLDTPHRAERFLIHLADKKSAPDRPCEGKLLIQEVEPEKGMDGDVNVGIYLNSPVRQSLADYENWGPQVTWSLTQLNAFSVATEEVSHFHYLVFHSRVPRQVSQFELELQGEIDKFLLAFFSNVELQSLTDLFDSLFIRFFEHYSLRADLNAAERERYTRATQGARNFLRKHRRLLADPNGQEKALRLLRRFYRLDQAEKVSLSGT